MLSDASQQDIDGSEDGHGAGEGEEEEEEGLEDEGASEVGSDRSDSSSTKRLRDGIHKPRSIIQMCEYVHARLGDDVKETLAVKAHKSAMSVMLQIKDSLLELPRESSVPRSVRMYLLYAGVAVRRRLALCKLNEVDESDLRMTMALLFVLQILVHQASIAAVSAAEPTGSAAGDDTSPEVAMDLTADDADVSTTVPVATATRPDLENTSETIDVLEQWKRATLESIMDDTCPWAFNTADVCQECLRLGAERCTSIDATAEMADLFFRSSQEMLRYAMLEGLQQSQAFLQLDSVNFLLQANQSNQNLSSIVELAESEAGQTLLRDLILSFQLPQHVVGVRRVGVLGRDSNQLATQHHTTLLNEAHEAAMRGAEWEYKHNPSEVVKACCLLSGLAIMLMSRKGDIRKDDAFDGRVVLPFLETMQPPPHAKRLILLPALNEWAVFSMDRKGKPVVHMRDAGLDGLGQCVLLLSKEHKSGS